MHMLTIIILTDNGGLVVEWGENRLLRRGLLVCVARSAVLGVGVKDYRALF